MPWPSVRAAASDEKFRGSSGQPASFRPNRKAVTTRRRLAGPVLWDQQLKPAAAAVRFPVLQMHELSAHVCKTSDRGALLASIEREASSQRELWWSFGFLKLLSLADGQPETCQIHEAAR